MKSFRMIATMATFGGLPAVIMAWYLALNSGLKDGAEGWHIEGASGSRASAADGSPAIGLAAVAGDGGETDEATGLGIVEATELGRPTTRVFAVGSAKPGMLVRISTRSVRSGSEPRRVLRAIVDRLDLAVDLAQPLGELTFDEGVECDGLSVEGSRRGP